jgi:hypothetical protein
MLIGRSCPVSSRVDSKSLAGFVTGTKKGAVR